jgi:hypothetical protein
LRDLLPKVKLHMGLSGSLLCMTATA